MNTTLVILFSIVNFILGFVLVRYAHTHEDKGSRVMSYSIGTVLLLLVILANL